MFMSSNNKNDDTIATSINILLAFIVGELFVIAWNLSLDTQELADFAVHSFVVQWSLFSGLALFSVVIKLIKREVTHVSYWFILWGCFVIPAVIISISYQYILFQYDWQQSELINWPEAMRFSLIAMIVYAVVARFMFLQQALQLQKNAQISAKLANLQNRIRPHFLFNALNSVISLILIAPEKAEHLLLSLTQLLRQNLTADDSFITLKSEIEFCQHYLDIEKMRFGERLQVTYELHSLLTENVKVPPLLLQPLIENAVIHGVEPNETGGSIRVSVFGEQHQLKVSIVNSLSNTPHKDSADHRTTNGIALENIRHRLQLIYGDKSKMSHHLDEHQYKVILYLPVEL
jgi:two-component system, LytTR family, sensor histidine kinase AlgZ